MRRLPVAGAVLSAIAAWYAAGCYWLVSTGDLTSGGADASSDVALRETGGEAGGPMVDAESEAGEGGDAGPFCPEDAGPYTYCMDFDGVDAASLHLYTNDSDTGIVDGVYVSPPSSLGVKLNGGWGTAGAYDVNFTFKPKTARLEYQFMPQPLGSWVTSVGISLWVSSTQTSESLQVLVAPDGEFQVQEWFEGPDGGTGWSHGTFSLDGGTRTGAWHHVVLTMTVDDSQGRYFSGLSVDDQALELDVPLLGPWEQGTAHLGIGSTFAQEGGADFYYDNVRADFGL
ncbi:MAG TPA: hypothetical protein VF765_17615 [Polyangiaceae bacterium]